MDGFLEQCYDNYLAERRFWPQVPFSDFIRVQLTKELVIGASMSGFFVNGTWDGASSLAHHPGLSQEQRLRRTTVDVDSVLPAGTDDIIRTYVGKTADALNKVFSPWGSMHAPERLMKYISEPGKPSMFRSEFIYTEARDHLSDNVKQQLPHTKGQKEHIFRVVWEVTFTDTIGREPRLISGVAGRDIQVYGMPIEECLAGKLHCLLNPSRLQNPRKKWRSDTFDVYWIRGLNRDVTKETVLAVMEHNGFTYDAFAASASKYAMELETESPSQDAKAMAEYLVDKARVMTADAAPREAEKMLRSVRQWVVSRWDAYSTDIMKMANDRERENR